MGLARTHAVALLGLTGALVEVEADISGQLPGMVLIGLPDAALYQLTAARKATAPKSSLWAVLRTVAPTLPEEAGTRAARG